MKQISIIIATFNAEKVLQRCLDSIILQKTSEVELLIIDGGSTDMTLDIIKKNENNIDFYLSEKDNGLYDAWNKGIKKVSGKWVVFLGSDDILLEGTISKQLNYLNTHNVDELDIISAKAWMVDESGNVLKTMGEPYSWNIFRRRMNISHGSTLHNRKLFEEVGFFDMNFRICGDYELLLRKKMRSNFIDDYFIQMQDGGMSTTLQARKEAYLARKKNKSLTPFENYLLGQREKWGYIIKHQLLKKMRSLFFLVAFFLLPAGICRWLCIIFGGDNYRIGKKCHIGFSIIMAEKLFLEDNTYIGHFNIIKTKEVHIAGKIRHLNLICGRFIFRVEGEAWIDSQNKITGSNIDEKITNSFIMRRKSSIIVHHIFDVTDNIIIGERTCIAGYGSQIWTHSFVFGTTNKAAQISKPVEIGGNCYIGSGCVLCPGVYIADNIVVGSHTTVSKDLRIRGLYVSQGNRFIPYDSDAAINQIEQNGSGYIFNR